MRVSLNRSGSFLVSFVLAVFLSSTAWAQGLQTSFDDTQGWTLDAANNGVGWSNDGTPSGIGGGPAQTGANSLNYNNGTDYDSGAANSGFAASPQIDISGLTSPTLSFWCNYEDEALEPTFDQRWLEISNDGFGTFQIQVQLLSTGASGLSDCGGMGQWHQHIVALDPSWGSLQVRFRFDSVDSLFNNFAGWFVDDFDVSGAGGGNTTPPVDVDVVVDDFDGSTAFTMNNSSAPIGWAIDGDPAHAHQILPIHRPGRWVPGFVLRAQKGGVRRVLGRQLHRYGHGGASLRFL